MAPEPVEAGPIFVGTRMRDIGTPNSWSPPSNTMSKVVGPSFVELMWLISPRIHFPELAKFASTTRPTSRLIVALLRSLNRNGTHSSQYLVNEHHAKQNTKQLFFQGQVAVRT